MDYFVAYHAADQEWAEWVGRRLQDAGYGVELQSYDYWARSSLILEMFAVSAIADATIALLSPDFLADNLGPSRMAGGPRPGSHRRVGHLAAGTGAGMRRCGGAAGGGVR